jgi:outer membrane protein assembly factor BamD (BamD/ComL family)
MKEREESIRDYARVRLTNSIERLVELYTAWEKPDEASKWQKLLDEAKAAAESQESK